MGLQGFPFGVRCIIGVLRCWDEREWELEWEWKWEWGLVSGGEGRKGRRGRWVVQTNKYRLVPSLPNLVTSLFCDERALL